MRLALWQINATVGDIAGNAQRIGDGIDAAREAGAELVLFPELALTGYPPEDLLLKEHFLSDARRALEALAPRADGVTAIVGFPERAEDVFNAAAVLAGGELRAIYRKVYLPNYGVFDEQRYFQAGPGGGIVTLGDETVGVSVCEDIWEPGPPASDEAIAGATLIVNISASPYHAGKGLERERMLAQRARDNLACVAFCALVGGQDELVFDGHSVVIDHTGRTIARAAQFREEMLLCEVDLGAAAAARLRDASHRPAARRNRARGEQAGGAAGARRERLRRAGRDRGAAARARRVRGPRRAVPGIARLRREERLRPRRAGPLRRDRFGARRLRRRRRPRRGAGQRDDHAFPLLLRLDAAGRARPRRRARGRGLRAADRRA